MTSMSDSFSRSTDLFGMDRIPTRESLSIARENFYASAPPLRSRNIVGEVQQLFQATRLKRQLDLVFQVDG